MSTALRQTDAEAALTRAHAAVDALVGLDLTALDDEALLGVWRELERLRRRLPSVEHQLVLEAEGRGLPQALELRGVAQLLRGLLRVDPHEAAGRVRAAHAAGTRRTLTGQRVPALFPVVAAAQAEGSISPRQARGS